MSIATEITRLQAAKSGIVTSLTNKGVTVPANALLGDFAALIDGIATGGGSGGGSATLYKCASVDTVNHTWTGYEAVLADGVYSFAASATTGLTYGDGLTPAVNGIYPDGVMYRVSDVYSGQVAPEALVFEVALDAIPDGFSTVGTVTPTVVDGRSCLYCNQSGIYSTTDPARANLSTGSAPVASISIRYRTTYTNYMYIGGYGYSSNGNGDRLDIAMYSGGYLCGFDNTGWYHGNGASNDGSWHHGCVTFAADKTVNVYQDGVLVHTATCGSLSIGNNIIEIGCKNGSSERPFVGHLTDFKIFNRVLTSLEIAKLAQQ